MKINTFIKQTMKSKKITQQKMGAILGLKENRVIGQNLINNYLKQPNMTVETINKFLDELGYELVVKPISRGKRPEGEYKIDLVDEE